ncbi:HeH/LEM domain-containing protein [Fructilactobacillus ixorae]
MKKPDDESTDSEKPTDANTLTEIKEYLNSQGIDYDSNAKKADLLKLVGD